MSEQGICKRGIDAIRCFDAFRWPVPRCFSSALAANRFEQGDVLYRDIHAYDHWSGSVRRGTTAVQVLDPPRSARATRLDGDTDRRRANWSSPVRILLMDLASAKSEERVLSQGQLLTAWWKGDECWLVSGGPQPDFPKTSRDLHANLDNAKAAFVQRAGSQGIRSGSLFVLVVDLASDASRSKAAQVQDRLRMGGKLDAIDLVPSEAGVESPESYHPTLVLRGLLMPGRRLDSTESDLRGVLYRGGGTRGVSKTSSLGQPGLPEPIAVDRFSIGRHGLLVPL